MDHPAESGSTRQAAAPPFPRCPRSYHSVRKSEPPAAGELRFDRLRRGISSASARSVAELDSAPPGASSPPSEPGAREFPGKRPRANA
jgi:hypothetical protein